MSFHDVRLPVDISYGAQGGPEWNTDVIVLSSGFEKRNVNWANPRRKYNVGYGIKTQGQLHTLLNFFHARQGRAYGFRHKDWSDYKSVQPFASVTITDQLLGVGNDVAVTFQLRKAYTSGGITYHRKITKPVVGSVRVSLADGEVFSPGSWSIDNNTGIITFVSPPADGVNVKAGFEFDVPVRFEDDFFPVSIENFDLGSAVSIGLVEVRI